MLLDSSGTGHRHAPGRLPGKSCRTGHRNESQVQPSLLRVMPFAVSEHSSELIGCPISWSFSTSCIDLELRSLSSSGITRLLQYYEPLRHPKLPGPSLTGVRLTILRSQQGVSCVACVSLVYMLSPLPRHSDWDHSCSLTQSYQPSPKWRSGRPVQRPFRGLLSVHSRYCLHTCAATYTRHASPEASTASLPPQLLRLLPAGTVAGWDFHPLGKHRLTTAHTNGGH